MAGDSSIHTPITQLLDQQQVSYRRLPHGEPVYTVQAAAAQRGVARGEIVKAILLRESGGQRRFVLACVLGDDRLDLKAVQGALGPGWRRLTFANAEPIRQVTGAVQGAVTPLALPGSLPVLFDEAISARSQVNISSGDVMLGLELATADLIRLAGARLASIATPKTTC